MKKLIVSLFALSLFLPATVLARQLTLEAEVVEVNPDSRTITVIDLDNGYEQRTFRYAEDAKVRSESSKIRRDKTSLRKGQQVVLELQREVAAK